MNELKIFNNLEFGEVRTLEVDGCIWFVGKDVASALGYKNGSRDINRHIDDEDRKIEMIPQYQNGTMLKSQTILINESGLYSLILSSNLPSAKIFKRWVTNEVLPSIRKSEGYILNQEELSPEEIISKALVVAHKIIADKEKQITTMQPKADYYDQLVDAHLLTNFRDTAKELQIKPKIFVGLLLSDKFIYRDNKSKLKPYQKYVDKGYLEVKEFLSGTYADIQTLVTPKGREHFKNLYVTI